MTDMPDYPEDRDHLVPEDAVCAECPLCDNAVTAEDAWIVAVASGGVHVLHTICAQEAQDEDDDDE